MPSEKIELPELPEPGIDGYMGEGAFTEAQMTAHALLAVKQERERLCDQLLAISARWDGPVRELLKETLAAIRQS